jgi:uncharacterized membrane protein
MATENPDQDPTAPAQPPQLVDAEVVDAEVAGIVKEAVLDAVMNASDSGSVAPAALLTTDEWEHLSKRDQRLLKGIFERIARRESLARDPDADFLESRTFGQRVADRMAEFGGSWPFILLFFAFLATWIALNVSLLDRSEAFDPYPFIFLNLLLSMLAAVQAPVIMMSQNRQAARDRAAAANDYAVNLRAEVEIRQLHDKLDELREGQWVALVSQQQEQIRLLELLCGPREEAGEGSAP